MAVAVNIAILSGGTGEGKSHYQVPEYPPLVVLHATAVGVVDIATAGGRFIEVSNNAGSDPVLVRFQLDADSTTAAIGDSKTVRIEGGQTKLFGVDEAHDSANYELDIRAAVGVRGTDYEAEYETVAASQTAQLLGATGGAGDILRRVVIVPATTSPGVVTIIDGATSIPIFVGGATSVSDLTPKVINLDMKAVGAGWSITTGANVSAIGIGDFLT